jgi:polyvinyl alcohol dehydrogenase (cytochrome)
VRARALVAATVLLLAGGAGAYGSTPSSCAGGSWAAFGRGMQHTFEVPGACSPISTSNVATLVPAWFVHTSDSVTASPAVVDGTAYVGSWDGTFYAINVETGAIRWTFAIRSHAPTAFGRIVSSAAVVPFEGRQVVLFGGGSSLWALDAKTGKELTTIDLDPRTPSLRARQEAGDSPVVEVESSPAVATIAGVRRIYVGLDVHNSWHVGRTGVVALELQRHGRKVQLDPQWKFDPETGRTYSGKAGLTVGSGKGFGCGGVWSSPAVDPASGIVAFGTASCDHPSEAIDAHENFEESMVAVDAVTGRMRWRFRPADSLAGKAAKVADANRDADFGASPNLFRLGSRTVVGEGRKSADYYVRDLRTGARVSMTDAGQEGMAQSGFGVGGFLGTPAVQTLPDGHVRVIGATAIPVPHSAGDVDSSTWAVRAMDPATGTLIWTSRLAGPSYGHTSIVGGVAFVPDTTTSSLMALDTATGLPLWVAPLFGPPSSTAVISGGMVIVGSGTRETDLEYKAVSSTLQDALSSTTGASPLSPLSGIEAFKLAP